VAYFLKTIRRWPRQFDFADARHADHALALADKASGIINFGVKSADLI
jgi:hypothetical protein